MLECPLRMQPVSRLVLSTPKSRLLETTIVDEWLNMTGNMVSQLIQTQAASQSLLQRPARLLQLRSLKVGTPWPDAHDQVQVLTSWYWEKEKTVQNLLELSSPVDLSEDEAEFGIDVTRSFVGKFHGCQGSSFQSHVAGRCLLSDDRLIGLLLLWEKYHDALKQLIQARYRSQYFARSLSQGNPELLVSLQKRWAGQSNSAEQSLSDIFRSHEHNIVSMKDDRDGYRNFAVNVCHVLNISCCRNCPKNLVPKFGGVEFRLFNTEFGEPMRLAMSLFQRLVQRSCTMPLAKFHEWTLNLGGTRAAEVTPFFELLGLNATRLHLLFSSSGPERWMWHC